MKGKLFLLCFLTFSAGVFSGRFFSTIVLMCLTSAAVLFCFLLTITRKNYRALFLITLLFFSCGAVVSSLSYSRMRETVLAGGSGKGERVAVDGFVRSDPVGTGSGTSFLLQCETVETVKGRWRSSEIVNVQIGSEEKSERLFPGLRLTMEGVVSGGKLPEWLETKGVSAQIAADSGSLTTGSAGAVSRYIHNLRSWLERGINSVFDEELSGLVKGYSLGLRREIEPETLDNLDNSGLSHITAVSGLHVGTAALIIIALARICGLSRKTGIAMSLAGVAIIVCVAGFRPSALRAAVMVAASFGGILAGRRYDGYSGFSIAGIAILALSPRVLFDLGFQYSFAAVLGILAANRHTLDCSFIRKTTAVWAAAQAGLFPLFIIHSQRISVASLPANMIAVPLVGPSVLLSIFAAGISHVSVFAGRVVGLLPSCFCRLVLVISRVFSSVPSAEPRLIWPAVSLILFGYALFLLITRIKKGERLFKAIAVMAIAVAVLYLPGLASFRFHSENRIIVFDVGQGDSILIQDETGCTVLVDGGPERELALEKIRNAGVKKIDLLVLTHPHHDHLGGLEGVLREMNVGRMLVPDAEKSVSKEWAELLNEVKERSIKITVARAGQIIELSPLCSLRVLYPDEEVKAEREDLNNASTVIMCNLKGTRILLTGDLEVPGQDTLMDMGWELDCDILKIPHQGSSDAASEEFMLCSDPELAVISVGRNNEYGHPSREFIDLLKKEGVETFRTDKMGDVEICIRDGEISVGTNRSE